MRHCAVTLRRSRLPAHGSAFPTHTTYLGHLPHHTTWDLALRPAAAPPACGSHLWEFLALGPPACPPPHPDLPSHCLPDSVRQAAKPCWTYACTTHACTADIPTWGPGAALVRFCVPRMITAYRATGLPRLPHAGMARTARHRTRLCDWMFYA